MHWKNTATRYGLVAIVLHWVVAVTVIGLAILGLWMVDLSYYSPYYRSAPFWHKSIGLTLFVILISGYLISTAKGQGISFFGWFEVPATLTGLPSQADRAGQIHYWMAMAVLALAGLHALGALKHHFLDRDDTLRRMLGLRPRHLTDRQE